MEHIVKNVVDSTKIWVKLCGSSVAILDQFYRELDGYFEFFKMEYDQIFEKYQFDNEILTEKAFYAKYPYSNVQKMIESF